MPNIDPTFLIQLMACVACGLLIYNQTRQAMGKNKAPTPLKVQAAVAYARKEDHEELKARFEARQNHVDRRFATLDKASSDGREKIYNLIRSMDGRSEQRAETFHMRLNSIAEEVAAQHKSDELTQATLARMDQKLDTLNHRKADKS